MSLVGIGALRLRWRLPDIAKCDYCGLYSPLGNCKGCGAPNTPADEDAFEMIEVTTFNDPHPVYCTGSPLRHPYRAWRPTQKST
jgi:hypothetical protein